MELAKSHNKKNAPTSVQKTTESFFSFGAGSGVAIPFFQPKLSVNTPGDVYEQQADAAAEKVMASPTGAAMQPISISGINNSSVQKDDNGPREEPQEPLTGGLSSVGENLMENNPLFPPFLDKLKLKLWDQQPAELRYGIIGFGIADALMAGTAFALDPNFRGSSIRALDGVNLMTPIRLIPHADLFTPSSFTYHLPEPGHPSYEFNGEFDLTPYFDLLRQHNPAFPQISPSFGLNLDYNPATGSMRVVGGTFNLDLFNKAIILSGGVNQFFNEDPQTFMPQNPMESPVRSMLSLPSESVRDTRFSVTIDVPRLVGFIRGEPTRVDRKIDNIEEEDKVQRKELDEKDPLDVQPELENNETIISRKETANSAEPIASQSVEQALAAPGNSLEDEPRDFMEERFQYDFSNVKIHDDSKAHQSASDINARAYTHQNHIVFGEGQYNPSSDEGKKLLAHELTHVVQQDTSISIQRDPDDDALKGYEEVIPITSKPGEIYSELSSYFHKKFQGTQYEKALPSSLYIILAGDLYLIDSNGKTLGDLQIKSGITIPVNLGYYFASDDTHGLFTKKLFYKAATNQYKFLEILREAGDNTIIEQWLEPSSQAKFSAILTSRKWSFSMLIIAPIPEPKDDKSVKQDLNPKPWAKDQVATVKKKLQQTSSTSTPGETGKSNVKTPDRLVGYVGRDGSQHVNVWVGGNSYEDGGVAESIELHEGETTEQLQDRVEKATAGAHSKLTDKASKEEDKITHGNIPYSDSTFLGGTETKGPRPNRPAYRADVTGPQTTVRYATNEYNMHLHYEDVSPILINQVWEAFTGSYYTWQIIDITKLYNQIKEERAAQIALQQVETFFGVTPTPQSITSGEKQVDDIKRTDKISEHQTVGRTAAVGRDLSRTVDNVYEDTGNAAYDLAHPLSSQDESSEAAIRSVVVNTFNLATLPLHSIMALGGWLVRSLAAIFKPHDDDSREIPFPDRTGVFLIRCVAQPRIHGEPEDEHGYELRMPSVAVLPVHVRDIHERTKEELKAQDQNLQASILELLVAFRNSTDEVVLVGIRNMLELKVQEAAQTNRSFLDAQIKERDQLVNPQEGQEQPVPDVLKKIEEELRILRAGTQIGSGTLSMILKEQIEVKEQELEKAKKNKSDDVRKLEKELDMLRRRAGTAAARESEMTASGIALIKPNAVFVNEADGQTIPLLIEIGQIGQRHTSRGYTMRVSDITSADGDEHNAIGPTQAAAIKNALKEYANHFPYGRGSMIVQLPEVQNYGITEMLTYRCSPHDTQQASERLDELLQLLAVLGLFVPGVGTVVMVAGAAVSGARILHKISNHTFEWDMNAIMDVLNILGAVAGGVSRLANAKLIRTQKMFALVEGTETEIALWKKELDTFSTIAQAAKWADTAVNNLSFFLGANETVLAYLEIQKQEILGNITHAEARRQRAVIIAQGMSDQFMQHAPTVVEGLKEQKQAHEPPSHLADDEGPIHKPDEPPASHDDTGAAGPKQTHDQDKGQIPIPVPVPAPETAGKPLPVHVKPTTPPVLSPQQRVEAFFRNRENNSGIIRGDMKTTRKLLETHGNWRDLMLHLESEPGNDIYGIAIENLQDLRRSIVTNLGDNFGLHLSDPKASTLASSDVDLATTGPDAGERLLHAEEFMKARYGENWSEKLRMNFYTAAERLFIYEQIRHLMSEADFGALQQQISILAETLNFAKMLQHAGNDAQSLATVEALMAYLPESQRAKISKRAAETPADAQKIITDLHKQIDILVTKFEALPQDDTRRVALASEITRMQMEANFRTQEAYISPGAGRHVVRGVAVHGYEAYQSAISQLEMMLHIVHTTGGNVETAVREYELYKYIGRFIEAMTTAGLPMDATILAYYQASFDVYRNSRTQLQGVGRHDLAWLSAYHSQFMKTAAEVLPKLRETGAKNAADWNPEQGSLQVSHETRTVTAEGLGETKEIKVPQGIRDETIAQPADEGTMTDADIERSFSETVDIPDTTKPQEGERVDRSVAGETYFVTDTASPRFSIRAYVERGHLRIDMRTVLEDGTRSSVLKGSEEFARILKFFEGQFDGILTNWQYGTNLGKVNELTGGGMPLDQALRQTWSAQKAMESGFTQIRIIEQSGAPGNYSVVKILFIQP